MGTKTFSNEYQHFDEMKLHSQDQVIQLIEQRDISA